MREDTPLAQGSSLKLLWVVMYGGAGILYILPTAIDYVIIGISAVGDWLLRIPP